MSKHEENAAAPMMTPTEFENRLYEARQELARLKASADQQRLWLVSTQIAAGNAFLTSAIECHEKQQAQIAKDN